MLSARPLELLPLRSGCLIGGRSRNADAACAAGLGPVGLSGIGFRLTVVIGGADGGISSTIGMLGLRFRCSGVVCRPRTGDSVSSGSFTSVTECRPV